MNRAGPGRAGARAGARALDMPHRPQASHHRHHVSSLTPPEPHPFASLCRVPADGTRHSDAGSDYGLASTLIVRFCRTECFFGVAASVTLIVNVNVPNPVGSPSMSPLGSRNSPAGSLPLDSDQV